MLQFLPPRRWQLLADERCIGPGARPTRRPYLPPVRVRLPPHLIDHLTFGDCGGTTTPLKLPRATRPALRPQTPASRSGTDTAVRQSWRCPSHAPRARRARQAAHRATTADAIIEATTSTSSADGRVPSRFISSMTSSTNRTVTGRPVARSSDSLNFSLLRRSFSS